MRSIERRLRNSEPRSSPCQKRPRDQPDCVFVEDPVVVLDEIAVVTRMGAEARRGESESLSAAVAKYRELRRIAALVAL